MKSYPKISFEKTIFAHKRCQWVDFHQAGSSQNEQSLLFQAFKALELSKAPCFVKRGQWVDFHQAGSSQNEQNLVLLTKIAKNGRWVNYTFLQKLSSFKFYCILEENCAADFINGRLLLTIAAKIVFGWVTLSCKSLLQWVECWEDRLPWVACCENRLPWVACCE